MLSLLGQAAEIIGSIGKVPTISEPAKDKMDLTLHYHVFGALVSLLNRHQHPGIHAPSDDGIPCPGWLGTSLLS